MILTNVCDEEIACFLVEGERPGITNAVSPNFRTGLGVDLAELLNPLDHLVNVALPDALVNL